MDPKTEVDQVPTDMDPKTEVDQVPTGSKHHLSIIIHPPYLRIRGIRQ